MSEKFDKLFEFLQTLGPETQSRIRDNYWEMRRSLLPTDEALERAINMELGKPSALHIADGAQEYDDILAGNAAYEALTEG